MPAKIDPATDCPACEKCGIPCAVPASKLEGRSLGGSPRALACSACGHAWIERSVDRVLQAWRAEIAWDDSQTEEKIPRPKYNGRAHMKRILDELAQLRARVPMLEAALDEADKMRNGGGLCAYDVAREATR